MAEGLIRIARRAARHPSTPREIEPPQRGCSTSFWRPLPLRGDRRPSWRAIGDVLEGPGDPASPWNPADLRRRGAFGKTEVALAAARLRGGHGAASRVAVVAAHDAARPPPSTTRPSPSGSEGWPVKVRRPVPRLVPPKEAGRDPGEGPGQGRGWRSSSAPTPSSASRCPFRQSRLGDQSTRSSHFGVKQQGEAQGVGAPTWHVLTLDRHAGSPRTPADGRSAASAEMSIIATPPVDRLGRLRNLHQRRWGSGGVREALLREKYRRGGPGALLRRPPGRIKTNLPELERFPARARCRR